MHLGNSTMNVTAMSRAGTGTQSASRILQTNYVPKRKSTRYRFADLELDLGRHQLLRGNLPLKLTKLTFNLLTVLVEMSPNVVHHDELAALAWGKGRVVTPETIAQRMMILRRSLYDSATRPRYIEGVRGQGYRLLVDVEQLAADPFAAEPDAEATPSGGSAIPQPTSDQTGGLYLQAVDLCNTSDDALALDSGLGVAAAARAGIAMHTWRWSQARREFASVEDVGWANDVAPWLYCWGGDLTAGVQRARRNLGLRPGSWIAHRDLGITLSYAGDPNSAAASLTHAARIAANPVTLAWLAYQSVASGDTHGARSALAKLERALQSGIPLVLLPELAYAYSRIGNANRADELFGQIQEHAGHQDIGCGTWAMAMLAHGEVNAAKLWLARAAEKASRHEPDQGFLNLMNLKMNFLNDPALEACDFEQLLARIHGN